MHSSNFKIIASLLMIAFLLSVSTGGLAVGKHGYDSSSGRVDVTTSQATISVTGGGNIPFFHIQLNSTNASYQVKFSSIQEFVDTNGNGKFDNGEAVPSSSLSLPSLHWNFGGFSITNDSNNNIQQIDFNFTTTGSPSLSLRNHIDLSKGNQIKFDLVINNYSWTSSNASAKLAVKFQIAGGNISQGSSGNSLKFGGGEFNTTSTASTSSSDINVATQVDSGSTFYLLFDHFTGGFVLDPTFSAVATSSSSNTAGISLELMPILAGLTVIGLVVSRRRIKT